MSKRVGFSAAAIAAVVGLLWLLLHPHPSEDAAPTAADRAAPPAAASARALGSAAAGNAANAAPGQPMAADNPSAAAHERPKATIRIDFESEARDADAAAVEARIRSIYAAEPGAEGVLRAVRCTQTVCKVDARWSAQLNRGYNAALLKLIAALSKEISLEPGGAPDGTATPIAIYVRRPSAKTPPH